MARVKALDALRGIAISLVVVHHVGLRFLHLEQGPVGAFLVAGGWAGVDLFFAISGYLIAGALLRDRHPGWLGAFFIRRAFRILPLYFVALLAYLLASLTFDFDSHTVGRLWINALFMTSWVIPWLGDDGVPYTITWSVSIEEFSYLCFGLLAAAGPASFSRMLCAIVVVAPLLRVLAGTLGWLDPIAMYYFVPTRIDSIAWGGVFAALEQGLLLRDNPRRRLLLPSLALMALFGCMAIATRKHPLVWSAGYTLFSICAAWLVYSLAKRTGADNLMVSTLARIGVLSYFIYLFHQFILIALHRLDPTGWQWAGLWGMSALVMLGTYFLATVSWRFFEHPLIRLGYHLATVRRASHLRR